MDLLRHVNILAPFFRRRWPLYLLGILILTLVDLLQLVIPRLIGKVIDHLWGGNYEISGLLLGMLGLSLGIALLRYVNRELIMGTTRKMEYYLRERLFNHGLRLPLLYFDRFGPGHIMALSINDITAVRMSLGFGSMLFIDAVVMGLASMLIMAKSISITLTFQSLIPLPLILWGATRMGQTVHSRFHQVQEKFSQLTEFSQETFGGLRVIKGFAAENIALDRFTKVSQDNVAANMAMARLQAAYIPLTHSGPLFCYAIALYFGGNLMLSGAITVGDFAAFLGYLGLIIWPVMGLGYLINLLQRGAASLGRLAAMLHEKPVEVDLPTTATSLGVAEIVIDNLTFTYPEAATPAIRELSLTIPAGATVGIVGRTGSGKSTLLKLLLRLYEVPSGSIFIQGQDIHQVDYLSLRQSIGYVPQDGMLFSRSISDNISFDYERDREEIMEAAALAAVREDIDLKPYGFGTVLGEKGRRLSGGQQQRVAIARALVKQPGILLLDDVFAALDYQTQAELLENMQTFAGGSTTLIVSQRVAAVKDADNIFVLDGGKVVETGTHSQLVAKGGLYFKLYEQQLVVGDI